MVWIMCRIPGTWYDSSTVNITVEEFCQHREKKKSCPWLLKNRASHCWRTVPVTVEQSYQWLLNNYASHCWTIVPVTFKELCQPLMNNGASDCWRIVPCTKNTIHDPLVYWKPGEKKKKIGESLAKSKY